jgi:hypothetical protein
MAHASWVDTSRLPHRSRLHPSFQSTLAHIQMRCTVPCKLPQFCRTVLYTAPVSLHSHVNRAQFRKKLTSFTACASRFSSIPMQFTQFSGGVLFALNLLRRLSDPNRRARWFGLAVEVELALCCHRCLLSLVSIVLQSSQAGALAIVPIEDLS